MQQKLVSVSAAASDFAPAVFLCKVAALTVFALLSSHFTGYVRCGKKKKKPLLLPVGKAFRWIWPKSDVSTPLGISSHLWIKNVSTET